MVSITDEIIGASQLLGAHALATNNSVMKSIIIIIVIFNIIIVVLLLLFYYYYYFYYYYFTCVVVEVRRGSVHRYPIVRFESVLVLCAFLQLI